MSEAKSCHISKGVFCMNKPIDEMPISFFMAYVAYIKATQAVALLENPPCVDTIYNSLYKTALKKIDENDDDDKFGLYLFLGIAIGAVFVIAILLLVIYFKRRKSDEEETNEGVTKLTT